MDGISKSCSRCAGKFRLRRCINKHGPCVRTEGAPSPPVRKRSPDLSSVKKDERVAIELDDDDDDVTVTEQSVPCVFNEFEVQFISRQDKHHSDGRHDPMVDEYESHFDVKPCQNHKERSSRYVEEDANPWPEQDLPPIIHEFYLLFISKADEYHISRFYDPMIDEYILHFNVKPYQNQNVTDNSKNETSDEPILSKEARLEAWLREKKLAEELYSLEMARRRRQQREEFQNALRKSEEAKAKLEDQLRKRKLAEEQRLLEVERRQKQRVEEVQDARRNEEETMKLKDSIRSEVRKKLKEVESLTSALYLMGIPVNGWPLPSSEDTEQASKKALRTFHPDRASRLDIHKQVEYEEYFKHLKNLKEKSSRPSN